MKKSLLTTLSLLAVLLGASDNTGGHEFVIDGYNGNELFHINWGWGGADDGYSTATLPCRCSIPTRITPSEPVSQRQDIPWVRVQLSIEVNPDSWTRL